MVSSWSLRWCTANVSLLVALLVISGCTGSRLGNENVVNEIDTMEPVRSADLSARTPRNSGNRFQLFGDRGGSQTPSNVVFTNERRNAVDGNIPLFNSSPDGKTYDLNLEQAEVSTAAKVIFSDILKSGFVIDPRVKGKISLSTGRAIPVEHILVYFENALRYINAAITKDPLGYKIIPLADATVSARIDTGGRTNVQSGYGVSVMPLQFVSVESILPLIDNFIVRQGFVKVDVDRNALLFQGTASERRAAMEAVLSFDQEWLSNQSVGIYRVESTNPQIVIREVEEILQSREGGRGAGLVQMVPIERLNGVMIVAKTRSMLRKTIKWLERLDRNDFNNVGIRVYQVQYADAAQLAGILSSMFLGGTASISAPSNAQSQFPPDSTAGQGSVNAGQSGIATSGQSATGNPVASPLSVASSGNALLENVRISADPTNNTILVYANSEKYKIIERAIAALDQRPRQVAIETTIAEITLNNELRHGVQFFLKSNDLGLGDDKGSIGLIGAGTNAVLNRVIPGFNLLFGPENEPRVIIDALRNLTEVNVLSQPTVVVRDNSVATLQIGDEVPITTRVARTTDELNAPIVNSISFRETGIILSVKPRISANGVIGLEIKQEISSVVDNAAANSLTPTISQRKVESSLSIVSGQTVLLGGLISQTGTNGSSGLPVLGDIPKWGDLFSAKKRNVKRTELILLIRPRIIRDEDDASRIAQEMRSRLQLLNRGNRVTPLRIPAESVIR